MQEINITTKNFPRKLSIKSQSKIIRPLFSLKLMTSKVDENCFGLLETWYSNKSSILKSLCHCKFSLIKPKSAAISMFDDFFWKTKLMYLYFAINL